MKKSAPCIERESEEKIKRQAFQQEQETPEKRRILLHSCCGPCSTACIERLLPDYKVTIFYYNPNITDRDEYEKRKANQIKFIEAFNEDVPEEDKVIFIEGEYLPEDFFDVAKGLEDCPEGGERCTECFKLRLDRTAKAATVMGYPIFGTTLTVSPHKNYQLISAIGTQLAEIYELEFLDMDFKKKAGFQRSIELSKKYELYRQNYCGCEFSKWEDK
ncbi:MAG: epoxyqueuosine reductase QueH [Firmicutes bacterium]|nr:epoxyqueuosine reductase QueH [Bacillota bacterium]